MVCAFPGGLPASLVVQSSSQPPSSAVRRNNIAPPKFIWRCETKSSSSSSSPTTKSTSAKPKTTATTTKTTTTTTTSLIGRDAKCIYTASVSTKDNKTTASSSNSQLLVGVYDKHRKQVTLYPIATNSVFALKQTVPSYLQETSSSNNNNNVGAASLSAATRHAMLFEDFGSAKKRKVLRSQAANRVNVDTVVGAGTAMVDAILTGTGMSESNKVAMQEAQDAVAVAAAGDGNGVTRPLAGEETNHEVTRAWRQSFLPPFDEQASDVQDVYAPRDLVGPVAWSQISRVVDAVWYKARDEKWSYQETVQALIGAKEPSKTNAATAAPEANALDENQKKKLEHVIKWEPSLYAIAYKLVQDEDEPKKDQIKCAVVAHYFMNLYLALHRRRSFFGPDESRRRYYGAPVELATRFMELFATEMMRDDGKLALTMSKANKDKCCLYILMLGIMATNLNTMRCNDIHPMLEDLKMDGKSATHLLKLAGFTIKRTAGGAGNLAVFLTTPLTFPPPARKAAARGGR